MRRRPSAATVLAATALFFSLGGTGLAASHYFISSVRQIAPKVRRELRGAAGPQGPQGPVGMQGMRGLPGMPGANADSGLENAYSVTAYITVTATSGPQSAVANCHPGDHVVLGGFDSGNAIVSSSAYLPHVGPAFAWLVAGRLDPSGSTTTGWVQAWALCAPSSG